MPSFDKRMLALLGILIVTAVFWGRFLSQASTSAAADAQVLSDPLAQTGEFAPNEKQGEFHGKKLASLPEESLLDSSQVLGSNDAPKRIEVDLTTQRLYAFEGDRKVYDFLISSGKWGRTPTGTFTIWGKYRYTKMEGGSKERNTYYYLPNVPFVMFFSNDEVAASRGFSLHGTYWHSNFGTPMSHGCINMKTEEAEQIFYWSNPDLGSKKSGRATQDNPGTQVIIYGQAPPG
jgi:lipoprotein-anchoring transpeptidase ErfK/SrfK